MVSMVLVSLSFGLDRWIGDPQTWLHPVQVMGWFITAFKDLMLKSNHPTVRKIGGLCLAVGLIGGTTLTVWGIIAIAQQLHAMVAWAMILILTTSTLAGKSLADASHTVLQALDASDLTLARTRLSYFVGRDTANLDRPEILRAVMETVAENAVDGVLAPLFYAIVGAFLSTITDQLFWVAALPLSYKAASTLDSMVGYLREPYTHIGWASAKIEDGLTWLPCRLTVMTLGLISREPRSVWRICRRDAPQDPSPNSGWSEAIYAAILGVQLGGINYYQGAAIVKPRLGENLHPIEPQTIIQAHRLTLLCGGIWLVIGSAIVPWG
ncbi:MAG: cobalamin biosynthesis protein CobD [Synechococcaceae cyanobacterium RL_1_2]|nr:cobalamin biosynthesis protein CobD [Synechococcaceae cyanobacterium RL_1_2]